jgi:prolyl-tRNA editing enzyme YbaK/EbsC (Cys-tRNA(Pro) deacylase)
VVTAGDAKVDNQKYKATFGCKAKMLSPEEAVAMTGHAVGGVCPFALPEVCGSSWMNRSKRFETVFPAAGSSNSAIELTPEALFSLSRAEGWADVCRGWQGNE